MAWSQDIFDQMSLDELRKEERSIGTEYVKLAENSNTTMDIKQEVWAEWDYVRMLILRAAQPF